MERLKALQRSVYTAPVLAVLVFVAGSLCNHALHALEARFLRSNGTIRLDKTKVGRLREELRDLKSITQQLEISVNALRLAEVEQLVHTDTVAQLEEQSSALTTAVNVVTKNLE
jgi:hypothetical protein